MLGGRMCVVIRGSKWQGGGSGGSAAAGVHFAALDRHGQSLHEQTVAKSKHEFVAKETFV